MSEKYIRIYEKKDVNEIKEHMLIFGDLSANCSKCNAIDIKLEATECPECKTPFKYLSFRNIKSHIAKIEKIKAARPEIIFVDFDDYKRHLATIKAENFLK